MHQLHHALRTYWTPLNRRINERTDGRTNKRTNDGTNEWTDKQKRYEERTDRLTEDIEKLIVWIVVMVMVKGRFRLYGYWRKAYTVSQGRRLGERMYERVDGWPDEWTNQHMSGWANQRMSGGRTDKRMNVTKEECKWCDENECKTKERCGRQKDVTGSKSGVTEDNSI